MDWYFKDLSVLVSQQYMIMIKQKLNDQRQTFFFFFSGLGYISLLKLVYECQYFRLNLLLHHENHILNFNVVKRWIMIWFALNSIFRCKWHTKCIFCGRTWCKWFVSWKATHLYSQFFKSCYKFIWLAADIFTILKLFSAYMRRADFFKYCAILSFCTLSSWA